MTRTRELSVAVGLAVAGSALSLVAAGRPWAHAVVAEGPLRLSVDPSGRTLAPAVAAFALAGLAGAVAVLATRRLGRLLTGVVLIAAGLAVAVSALITAADLEAAVRPEAGRAVGQREAVPAWVNPTPWPWLAGVGGLLTAGSGALTVLRGRHWPGMSGRYQARPERRESSREPGGLWDALDRGDDPTA